MVKYNEKIFSSTYYGARVLITVMVIILIFFVTQEFTVLQRVVNKNYVTDY